MFAEAFTNSYSLAFFACCREIYDKTRHVGFLKGTLVIEEFNEEPEEIEATKEMIGARGNVTINLNLRRQNFAFCFGCKPSQGVLAETKMVKDVVKILLEDYDRNTFSVRFMDCFDDLKGSDVNFEMVASNTLQPVRMFYQHRIVTEQAAIVFVHTESLALKYNEAETRGKLWEDCLNDVWGVPEVQVYTDPTKEKMIEVLT